MCDHGHMLSANQNDLNTKISALSMCHGHTIEKPIYVLYEHS